MIYGFNKKHEYCIASMGRCGSTMMTLYLMDKFGEDKVVGTHARNFVEFDGKVIFLFGNPLDIVVSAHTNMEGLKRHYGNMGADWRLSHSWIERDSLHLEDLFDDWYRQHEFPIATVRYETLWKNLDKLGEFLGISTGDFPKKKKRKTDWRDEKWEDKRKLKRTYKRIVYKTESAKDFKIWLPRS